MTEKMLNVFNQAVNPDNESVVMNSFITASGDNFEAKSILYESYAEDW
jgi:hypothetical protein